MKARGVQKKILDSKNCEELQAKLNIANSHDFLLFLFNYIFQTVKLDEKEKYPSIQKTIEYIDDIISKGSNKDVIGIIDRIHKIRLQMINKIKSTPKRSRANNETIKFLRNIANQLETIEVSLEYDIKLKFTKTNSEIIKYILFREKNIEISEDLITKHPYLINLCSSDKENILNLVIDRYLNALGFYINAGGSRKNIEYYDEILYLIFQEEKISIDSRILERNILKVKKWQESNANNKEAMTWLNHLYKRLDMPTTYSPNEHDYKFLYGIEEEFNKDILSNCQNINTIVRVASQDDGKCLITVDDEEVFARDDAFSISKNYAGNYILGIHFADVNHYCNLYPFLRQLAHDRVETIYLRDKAINLFPPEFIKKELSLDQGMTRLVRSIYTEFDTAGNFISFLVKKEPLKINCNFSFKTATKIMKQNSSIRKVDESFEKLLIVAPMIKKILFGSSSSPQKAEKLTETFMIFASYKIAEYFKTSGYPFLYKSHILRYSMPHALSNKLETLDKVEHNTYIKEINSNHNIDATSYFSVDPICHEGLHIPYYTRYTSPIREYAGIVVNDCLDQFYFSHTEDPKGIDAIRQDLKQTADYLNVRSQEIAGFISGYSRIRKR
ncbi:MAG TPA: RNB domain-containing ribonuclease [Bacilli bacterium]|nr:RNB domain-containing ribonuclease [Bacilli bacterium]